MKSSNGKYPSGIWIHGSAGKDGVAKDWSNIKQDHISNRGFDDIGYHYGIEQVGGIYQIMTGRGLEWQGAHVKGWNDSIGICLVGNFDKEEPNTDALVLLSKLVLSLLFLFDKRPCDIHFHNEVSTKTCPGKLFPEKRFIKSITEVYNKCLVGIS